MGCFFYFCLCVLLLLLHINHEEKGACSLNLLRLHSLRPNALPRAETERCRTGPTACPAGGSLRPDRQTAARTEDSKKSAIANPTSPPCSIEEARILPPFVGTLVHQLLGLLDFHIKSLFLAPTRKCLSNHWPVVRRAAGAWTRQLLLGGFQLLPPKVPGLAAVHMKTVTLAHHEPHFRGTKDLCWANPGAVPLKQLRGWACSPPHGRHPGCPQPDTAAALQEGGSSHGRGRVMHTPGVGAEPPAEGTVPRDTRLACTAHAAPRSNAAPRLLTGQLSTRVCMTPSSAPTVFQNSSQNSGRHTATFAGASRDAAGTKDAGSQPDRGALRARSGMVLSTRASVPGSWAPSPARM